MTSLLVVTLKLLEGEDLSTVLGVLHGCTFGYLVLCIHFLYEEGNNLSLVDVTMIGVYLNQGLNKSLALLR